MPRHSPAPATPGRDRSPTGRRAPAALVLAALLALAFNLRPAAVSVGPALGMIRGDLRMSDTVAGVLTAVPDLCFAVFGAVAPALARRFGAARVVFVGTVLMVLGQSLRAFTHSTAWFLALSVLALAGMATANVLLPSLVKAWFPERIGLVTALYSTSLTVGVTVASLATVPLAHAAGGWRGAFLWLTGAAVVAVVAWALLLTDRTPTQSPDAVHIPLSRVARTRLGWIMAGFFGIQSAMAYSIFGWLASMYTAAGYGDAAAGVMLAIATGVGIPLAFLWPARMARNPRPLGILAFVMLSGMVGTLGLLLAPRPAPLGGLWATLLAIGTSSFPMILALFGLRARTSEGTAALSGFTQSIGYLIAALGPFGMGVLHQLTGSWRLPLLAMALTFVPMSWLGWRAVTAGQIEDQLP